MYKQITVQTVQFSTDVQTNQNTDSTVQFRCTDKSQYRQYSIVQMYRKSQYTQYSTVQMYRQITVQTVQYSTDLQTVQYSTDVQTNHSTDSTV